MSLTSSLLTAISGIITERGGLAVVSNNIANVNTPGYTREVANYEEAPPVPVGDLQFGTGVSLGSIQSIRNNVLQLRLDQEAQNQGRLDTFSTGLNQIQPLFNECSGVDLQSLLSQFFNGFQQLAADPTNTGLRQAVIANAQSLATGFRRGKRNRLF